LFDDTTRDEFEQVQASLLSEFRAMATHSRFSWNGASNPSMTEDLLLEREQSILAASQNLAAKVPAHKLQALAKHLMLKMKKKMQGVASHEDETIEVESDASGTKDSGAVITKESLVQFVADLKRFSRSCETSSDRFALLVTNANTAASVDVVLSGGNRANPAAMKKQLEEFRRLLEQNPQLAEKLLDGQGTHPAGLGRALQYDILAKSLRGRTLNDVFLKSLDVYLNLAGEVDGLEKAFAAAQEDAELVQMVQLENTLKVFQRLEKNLMSQLMNLIIQDIHLKEPSIEHLQKALVHIHGRLKQGDRLNERIIGTSGLIQDLGAFLDSFGNETAKALAPLKDVLNIISKGVLLGGTKKVARPKTSHHNCNDALS
jgi:hypothetical protein